MARDLAVPLYSEHVRRENSRAISRHAFEPTRPTFIKHGRIIEDCGSLIYRVQFVRRWFDEKCGDEDGTGSGSDSSGSGSGGAGTDPPPPEPCDRDFDFDTWRGWDEATLVNKPPVFVADVVFRKLPVGTPVIIWQYCREDTVGQVGEDDPPLCQWWILEAGGEGTRVKLPTNCVDVGSGSAGSGDDLCDRLCWTEFILPVGVIKCDEECGNGPGTDIDIPGGTAGYPGECCNDLAETMYLTPSVDQNQFPPGITCDCFQESAELNFNAALSTPGVLEVWTGQHTYCDVVYNFTLKCIQPFGSCNLRLSIQNEAGGTPPYTVADGECSPAGDEPPTNTTPGGWSWEITGSTGNCCQIAWTGFTILWTLTK